MRSVLNPLHWAPMIGAVSALLVSGAVMAQQPTTQPDQPPSIKQPDPQPTVAEVPASVIIKVLTGNWYELWEMDLQKLDPASAEMVIQRSVQPVHDGDAVPRYLKALLYKPEPESGEEIDKRDSLTFEQRCIEFADGFMDSQLGRWESAQYHLRSAYVCTQCNWPRNPEAGFAELLPELGSIRAASTWNLWLAERCIGQGRPWEALRLYREALAMGRDVGRGPFLISTLVGVAIESKTLNMLLEAVPLLIDQGIEPERILRVIGRRYRMTVDPVASLSCEQGIWLSSNFPIRRLAEGETAGFWADWDAIWPMMINEDETRGFSLKESLVDKGWISRRDVDDPNVLSHRMLDEVEFYNKTLDRGFLTLRLATTERREALASIEANVENEVGKRPSLMVMPALRRTVQSVYRVERQRLALNLLLAGICYRNELGTWPTSVQEVRDWRPEYSGIDPVTSDPFTLSCSDNTITVNWTPMDDHDAGPWSITLRD